MLEKPNVVHGGGKGTHKGLYTRGDFRFGLGNEKRTYIKNNLIFLNGLHFFLSFNFNYTNKMMMSSVKKLVLEPSMGYRLGIQYRINQAISFNLHSIPKIGGRTPYFSNIPLSSSSKFIYEFKFNVLYGFGVSFSV
ncbi:MAG: hypothetical protein ABEH43_08630 [Flavobacteriales bacterium]